jgi:hypothetical protein
LGRASPIFQLIDHNLIGFRVSIEVTINSIVSLFGDNYDLIEEFNKFLPRERQIDIQKLKSEAQLRTGNKSVIVDEKTSIHPSSPTQKANTPDYNNLKARAQQLIEMIQVYFTFISVSCFFILKQKKSI